MNASLHLLRRTFLMDFPMSRKSSVELRVPTIRRTWFANRSIGQNQIGADEFAVRNGTSLHSESAGERKKKLIFIRLTICRYHLPKFHSFGNNPQSVWIQIHLTWALASELPDSICSSRLDQSALRRHLVLTSDLDYQSIEHMELHAYQDYCFAFVSCKQIKY